MRLQFVLLVCIAVLGGCAAKVEPLYSETPLFDVKDPTAVLRPGLWLWEREGCPVDTDLPLAEWPECADSVRVASDGTGAGDFDTSPYLVVLNLPRILQIGEGDGRYVYELLTSVEIDADGLVTGFHRGWLDCTRAPPPPVAEDEGEAAPDPAEPPPVEEPQGPSAPCPVEDAQTVIDLAVASLPETPQPPNFRWVRDSTDDGGDPNASEGRSSN